MLYKTVGRRESLKDVDRAFQVLVRQKYFEGHLEVTPETLHKLAVCGSFFRKPTQQQQLQL